jgi:hypothetical protein
MKVSINPPILTPNREKEAKTFITGQIPARTAGDLITVRCKIPEKDPFPSQTVTATLLLLPTGT